MTHPLQTAIRAQLLALVPGAQADTTRVTIEHRCTQLDVQSVDSWSGSADGLACRLAEHLRTAPAAAQGSTDCGCGSYMRCANGHCGNGCSCECGAAVTPEKGTPAEAGAELTPVTTVMVALARALREQPTGRQVLDGLDELGELSVCDEDPREIASQVAALCYLAQIPAPAPAAGPTVVYRAEHDAIVAGLYTTSEAAQRHCEVLVSREYPASAAVFFEWCVDEADQDLPGLELDVRVDGEHISTGCTVTPLEVAAAYDPDADE